MHVSGPLRSAVELVRAHDHRVPRNRHGLPEPVVCHPARRGELPVEGRRVRPAGGGPDDSVLLASAGTSLFAAGGAAELPAAARAAISRAIEADLAGSPFEEAKLEPGALDVLSTRRPPSRFKKFRMG